MAVFTNRATLSYNGKSTASNLVTGEIVGALTVTKTALSQSYSAGDTLTYIVTLVNTGSSDMTGITLTDDLGAYQFNTLTLVPAEYVEGTAKYFVNGVPQPDPSVTAGDTLVISGITVPAGGSATVAYSVLTNSFAPLGEGASIVNTVSAASAKATGDLTASETVTPAAGPELGITKSVCPASVAENGELTYTFVIANYGADEAGADADVVLSDTFDPVLTGVAVTYNGTPLVPATDYTYSEATGELATLPGVITVPAASFTHDPTTGEWSTEPGTATIVVKGTV